MEDNNKKQIKISLITLLKIVFLLIVLILLICSIAYWKALDEKIEIEEQKLEKVNREGFTVVEWGGSILNESIIK